MRNYCEEIQSTTGRKHSLLEKYQKNVRKAAEWYKIQHNKYNIMLQSEMLQALTEDIVNSNEEVDLVIDDYDDNFGAKLSLFCVSDFLCKHILSTFSYGPINTPTRQFNGKECSQSWFEYKEDAIVVTEVLQDILFEHNEGKKINLSVLLEDRQARSKLTHGGDIAICLSAIRCYNIIREMIIFMDNDYESQLPKFIYPDGIRCDMQAFFSHTDNMNFNQRTTILVAGSLHDVSNDQRELLANMPWDIVIDFDAYTEFGGLKSTVKHNQIQPQLLTIDTARNIILKKGITTWFKCGQMISPSHDEVRSKTLKILATKKPFYKGKFHKYYYEVEGIFKELIQKVAQKLNPVTIVYLYSDDKVASELLKLCEAELDTISYTFSGIYYWNKEVIQNLERNIYSTYLNYEVDYSKSFQFLPSDLDSFFRGLKVYENNFDIREDSSTDTYLPSCDGYKELSINQTQNLEAFFEVLYKGCGQEDYRKAEELLYNFYRGGNVPWCAFENKDAADLISPEELNRILNRIKTQLGRIPDINKDKIFYLEHSPGIGGSTLLRQIGWELHSSYPVLLINNFDRNRVYKLITDLYDYLSKGVVILADENCENIDDLETLIKELPRACVLVAAVRQSNGVHNSVQKLPLTTITQSSERQLRNIFKKNSPLSINELKIKDDGYDDFIKQDISSMKCPFMIGLYYMDKHFNGVNGYADQVILNVTNGIKELKVIAFMALCDIYAQESLPAIFVNKYIGLSPRSIYTQTNEYVKSAFYIPNNQDTTVYRPKHYLISECLLEKCSLKLYGVSYREKLADIAIEFIDAVFEECTERFSDIYKVILEKIFIRNRIGNNMNSSDFSKIIEEIALPEKRKEILLKLATLSANLADKKDPLEYDHVYMMTAHFYGHLSRLCSKRGAGIDNVVLAVKYMEKSIDYMNKCQVKDSRVFHMYGEAKSAVLKEEWDKSLKINEILMESNYINYEDDIVTILDIYLQAAQAGSPGFAYTSQMGLLVEYLHFVYRKKGINSIEKITVLSPTQHKYRMDIEELISLIDGVELDENTENIYINLLNQYRSNIMMNDFGKAIEYYQNRLDYLQANNGTVSEIINARQGLVNARIGKYRCMTMDGKSYFSSIPIKELEEIIVILGTIIEQGFDINRYQARQQRISTYNRWMELAKYSSQPIDKGIMISLKWVELEELDKLNDPRPYYYLYVLYYLSVLEGNKANIPLATEYQKLSYQKAMAAGYKLDYIKDFFVKGSGMGQLQNSNCVNDWSNVLANGEVDFQTILGYFSKIESKKGIVEIQSPINWLGRIAKFKTEERNDLGIKQVTHSIGFYGGFSYEQIIALNMSVTDIEAGEQLPIIEKNKKAKRSEINENNKEFMPIFVTKDQNTGNYYLNGKVENRNAGLSENDILRFGKQVEDYGDTETIMNLLNGIDKFQVKCLNFNGRRYAVSLFETGKTLNELLGEPKAIIKNDKIKCENEESIKVITTTIDNLNNETYVNYEQLPELNGEVLLMVTESTGKGVKGTFEKEGKVWFGNIPTGISKKEGKLICGKTIKARIISKNKKEYILKK